MNRAVIAGASGFVGTAVLQALIAARVDVSAISRRRRDSAIWQQADLTDVARLVTLCRGADTIFHIAGHAHAWQEKGDDRIHRETTIEGTRNLLQAAVAGGVKRFIFFSSVKAGGEGGESEFYESSFSHPLTAYGLAKREAEDMVLDVGRTHGLHVCNLRLSMVYGAGMKGNLPRMIEAVNRGRFPSLPETNNRRSMVSLHDVVRAALLVAKTAAASGQTYIVTDGDIYSTRRIYEAICLALGKPIPRWTMPMAVLRAVAKMGDIISWARAKRFPFDSDALEKLTGSAHYSSVKIVRELGFRPTKKLEDVLPDIISDYRARGIIHR